MGRDLPVAEPHQGEDHRLGGQEGDDKVPPAQPGAGQGVETGGCRPGRDVGLRRVRPGHAPHQHQAGRFFCG